MLIVGNYHLLTDAEIFENVLQSHIRSYFSSDFGKMVEAFAKVLADKIT